MGHSWMALINFTEGWPIAYPLEIAYLQDGERDPSIEVGQLHSTKYPLLLCLIKPTFFRLKTIKILEENIGSIISDISSSYIFSDMLPQVREIKEKVKKCDCIETKSLCTVNKIINKMKRLPTERENIFTTDTSGKGLISKIYLKTYRTQHQKNKLCN